MTVPIAVSQNRLRNSNLIVVSKTANYTALRDDDVILVDATAQETTVTLPAAADNVNKLIVVKKTDASLNAVLIDANGTETIDGELLVGIVKRYQPIELISDGVGWHTLNRNMATPQLLSATTVLLTAVAQTSLLTVPTGMIAKITDVQLEGVVAQSGGTSSKLLIGTTGASYVELLNQSTGHTFISGTPTSLLGVGKGVRGQDLYPGATMSVVNTVSFAAAAAIKADVSGTVVTAGSVLVKLFGYLIAA